ncbi:MAG TPA: outer membrane lipoprotein carrier protein LolA [Gammaproteobacteria bacterium]|nr:outer membrane lipoprotein carrier protein LolA [Gammaproteobacteria bacterium]MEC8011918.1 outer membrane lipoprotein chaperone LolA [Pseudomonadota bacterium]HBF08829.1 outer membrane lipoprotein carrier protein LolA [Gammaproteobacteria bacterium]HCK92083.1 outer membrane lipoprotein carrier protein LolA [Gammaproteobacteria bacterium]|tara:strand:- start:46546 stop:47211 length:666 start_codon:yes stop_codon:yes gene_type:complete
MMKKISKAAVFCTAAVMSMTSFAAMPAPEKLESLLEPIQSWSADFKQQVLSGDGKPMQALEGHLSLLKPLQFDWKTYAPYPQVVISNGNDLWIYDEDLEQVVIRPIDQELIPMPAAILSGEQLELLAEHFEVTYLDKDGYAVDPAVTELFQLKPKDLNRNGDFETLQLGFAKGQLKQLSLYDALGQVTHLVFEKQELNPKLKKSLFEFDMPPGIDVIDERQ